MNGLFVGQPVLVVMPAITSAYDGKVYPEERFYATIHKLEAACRVSGLPGMEVINENGIHHVDPEWVQPAAQEVG